MAHSFISIDETGFWAHDTFVEAMQLCLIGEIENVELGEKEKWLTEYKIELALQALPLIYGGMSMALKEFVLNKEREDRIIAFVELIIERINNEADYMTGESMQQRRSRAMEILRQSEKMKFKNEKEFLEQVNDSRWLGSTIQEVKNRYVRAFDLLKKLIRKEMKTTAASKIDYWNFE